MESYQQAWAKRNPDKFRATQARCRDRHRESIRESQRVYRSRMRADHPEYVKATRKRWYDRRADMIVNPRSTTWSSHEDAIVMRDDLQIVEMAHILQRKPQSIAHRQAMLRLPKPACECCGDRFTPTSGRSQRFCTPACRNRARIKRGATPCALCGESFRPRTDASRFCSKTCYGRSRRLDADERRRRIQARNRAQYVRNRDQRLAYAKEHYRKVTS